MKSGKTGTFLCLIGNILTIFSMIIFILYYQFVGNDIRTNIEIIVDAIIVILNSSIIIIISILFLKGKIFKEVAKLYKISIILLSIIILFILCVLFLSTTVCCYIIIMISPLLSLIGSFINLASKVEYENKRDNK